MKKIENENAINDDKENADAGVIANVEADVEANTDVNAVANAETNYLDIGNDDSGNNDSNTDNGFEADAKANDGKEEAGQSELEPQVTRSSVPISPQSSFDPGTKRRREISAVQIENSAESSLPRSKRRKSDELITTSQPHIDSPTAHNDISQVPFFNQRLEELKAYKAQYGHYNISPHDGREYKYVRKWCRLLRTSIRKKERGEESTFNISDDQIKDLTEIGFDWDIPFSVFLEDLKAYKVQHGHCNPSRHDGERYKSLETWCDKVRLSMMKKERKETPEINISDDQIKVLTEIEFVWDPCFVYQLEALKAFKARRGHCNIGRDKKDRSLKKWCAVVRSSMEKKERSERPPINLSDDQIKVLTDLGFKWVTEGGI